MAVTTASGRVKRRREQRFTANGTWTVPDGVFYAEAEVCGGGGGMGDNADGVSGSDSSVAFAGGTVTGRGGGGIPGRYSTTGSTGGNGQANSGLGAAFMSHVLSNRGSASNANLGSNSNRSAVPTVAGAQVSPADSVTVTVGAGGNGTGADGGSGYVIIRWEV